MAPLIRSSRRPLARRPQTRRRTLRTRPRIPTRVAVIDGVASLGKVGAHKVVVIFREQPPYETMNMIPSNYHLIKNVTDFGELEMMLGWAWSESSSVDYCRIQDDESPFLTCTHKHSWRILH